MNKTKMMLGSMKDAARLFTLFVLGGAAAQAADQASTITNTVAYEYDYLGRAVKTIVEPDNPQLRVETVDTYNGGLKSQSTVSSPAIGLTAIAPRTTKTGYGASIIQINALGHQTITKVNYNFYRRTEVKAPDTTITSASQDSFGRPLKSVKADGSETRISHKYCTGTGNGTASCPASAAYVVEAQAFGAAGNVPPISPYERKYFDALDRLLRTETQGFDGVSNIFVDYEYDALGRLYRTSRPYYSGQSIYWTTYEYDALNRVRKVTAPDGSTVVTERSGLMTTVTNALNQSKITTVDSDGKPVQVKDAQNNVLTYAYDANGKLVKTVDPMGNAVRMTYDILGRQLSLIDPDRGTTTYEYDVLGQLKRQTDQRGKVTNFAYDLIGRIASRSEEDLNSTWSYDRSQASTCAPGPTHEVGKLCTVTTDNGYTHKYNYDGIGRIRFEAFELDGSFNIFSTYDATTKRLATVAYGSGLTLKYVYTSLGYLKEIRDNATNALYWRADAMDAEGHLTQQTYGNNVVTRNVFDPATGRLKNIYAGPGNAVQDMSFEYDKIGNMLWRVDATQSLSETFEYDSLNRLTANTVNSPQAALQTQSYSYDSIGNITSRSDQGTYAYGTNGAGPHAVSQITQAGGVVRQLSYDAIGSMVLDQTRDAGGAIVAAKTRSISYTSFGMPSTIMANGTSSTFLYGPDHQRIKQITPTGNTIYIHPDNAGGLGYERESKIDGTVEHRYYVSANGIPVALIKKKGTVADTTITATSTSYLHRDHLGSSAAVTDTVGTMVERMAYEPFGKRRQPVGPIDTNNQIVGVATDRGFTTHEHLDELGLIHMNGRVYDPTIGRFISADPTITLADDLQSYNRYSYGYNDPMSGADPTGFTYVRACVADSSSKVCRWVNNGDGLEGSGGGGGGGTSSSGGGRGGGGAGKNSGTDPFAWIEKLLGKQEEKTRPYDCQLICIDQTTLLASPREFNTGNFVQDSIQNYNSQTAAAVWNGFVEVGKAWAASSMALALSTSGASPLVSFSKEILLQALGNATPKGEHPFQFMSILDDGTKVLFRKDFGEWAHEIGAKFQGKGKIDHYNIEIQNAAGRKLENIHAVPKEGGGFIFWGKDKVIKQ